MSSTPAPPAVDDARVKEVLAIRLHRFLGVQLPPESNPAAGIRFPVDEAAQNQANLLHGGVVTALLDVASYLALLPQLGPEEHAVTRKLSVQLLRPVSAGSRVELTGALLRRGRAVVFLRGGRGGRPDRRCCAGHETLVRR